MSKIHRYTLITVVAIILLPIAMLVLCTDGRTTPPYVRTTYALDNIDFYCRMYHHDHPGQRPTVEYLVPTFEEDRKSNDLITTFQIAKEQPVKDFEIMKLVEKDYRRGEYLYTNVIPESNLPENSIYIYACGAAAKEKPKGNYWAYKMKNFSDYWVVLGQALNKLDSGVWHTGVWLIRSSVPPVPGCYFIGDEQLYYPDRAVEALKAYYPNASLEKGQTAKIEEIRKLWPSGQTTVSPSFPRNDLSH